MSASVHNLERLREFRAALIEFAEQVGASIASVDSDVARTGQWLWHDRPSHWKRSVRKAEEDINRWKGEIARKQLIRAPEPASVVLEQRQVLRAKARLEWAQRKADATRRWCALWERESLIARGPVIQLSEFVHADIPRAVARLDRLIEHLENYLSIASPQAVGDAAPSEGPIHAEPGSASARIRHLASPRQDVTDEELFGWIRAAAADIDARARTPSALPDLATSTIDPLNDADAGTLSRLSLVGPPPDPSQSLVVLDRALADTTLFLCRLLPTEPTSSGWVLGSMSDPTQIGACQRIPIASLLAARPDLAPILALSPGSAAVLNLGTVSAVLDERNRNVWRANL